MFSQPTVWILHPTDYQKPHYGVYRVNEYDKWEIRPIRRNQRANDPNGVLATVAMFEEGCHRKKIRAPWREHNSKMRRANVVYLNPSRKDIYWGSENYEKFKQVWNIPRITLGEPLGYALPHNMSAWVDGIWSYSKESAKRIAEAMWPQFSTRLPWEKLWKKRETPSRYRTAFLAHDWGDIGSMRHPELARAWVPAGIEVKTCKNSRLGLDLVRATACDLYIIASTRESVPFDAMIALARGCTLVAPDQPIFRRLPGRKILYPSYNAGDKILWSQGDVGLRLQTELKDGRVETANQC